MCACLAVYLFTTYWRALSIPFLGDDYLILDKISHASFLDLWRPRELLFNWYRPWSREFHYWALLHTVGLREAAYHLASFALWLVVMVLYYELVRRITERRATAAVATAGLAALFLWGAPLLWIAGVQDLWMLVWSLLFLHAFVRGRSVLAWVALPLALLSKETAAVLPGIALAYVVGVERRDWKVALRRVAGFVALVAAWAAVHPTISGRLLAAGPRVPSGERSFSVAGTVARMILAQLNMDAWPAPSARLGAMVAAIVVGGGALATLVLCVASDEPGVVQLAEPGDGVITSLGASSGRLVAFGAVWAALGFGLLVLPSIGWHAYYGSLGSLGFWLAVGVLLARHRGAALTLVLGLVVLGQARASTVSWDWGTAWYQERAGNFLAGIRARMFELHPHLPAGSWVYFANVPNNIGFLGGEGPVLRIWYGEPNLHARFLSRYAPRMPADTVGADYFFRFDMRDTLHEINAGPESTFTRELFTPEWRHDHAVLASTFLRAGDLQAAARQYATLWTAFPANSQYAMYAACTEDARGDTAAARRWYRVARLALGDSLVGARSPAFVAEAQGFLLAAQRRGQ